MPVNVVHAHHHHGFDEATPRNGRRARLLSVLASEEMTYVGTGSFSRGDRRSSDADLDREPERCIQYALQRLAEVRSPGEALAWFTRGAGGAEESPIDVLERGDCRALLRRLDRELGTRR